MAIFQRRFSVYLTALYEVTNVPKYMCNTTRTHEPLNPLEDF